MKHLFRAASRLATPLVISALAVSATHSAALGAPVRKGPAKPAARPAAGATVKANNEIIPLPLNPTLPAGQRVCEAKTASGLGYTMLRATTGAKPAAADYVLVSYIGYLASNGAVFDQGQQVSFPVNGVIPGFSEGLQMVGKGGIARLCIPSAMGYGPQGSGPIPANADLVFQVELLDYKTAAEIDAIRKAREAAAAPSGDSKAGEDKTPAK